MKESIHYAIASLAGAVIVALTIKQNLSEVEGMNLYRFDDGGFGIILTAVGVYFARASSKRNTQILKKVTR